MVDASDPSPAWQGWLRWLGTPKGLALSVVLGTFLAIPAVGPYLALDDFILGLVARGQPDIAGLRQGTLDLFGFTTGLPDDNRALVDGGIMLPWWTDPELRIAFFRPISSLTHRLDFALFPGAPAAMHAHSLLWLGIAIYCVARLYRRVETSPAVVGLATLLYALDDAHGMAVGWLSNRNAIIATALAALVITMHVDGERRDDRRLALLAPTLFAGSLLAGEFAIGALAYVIAHAVCLARGSAKRRALGVAPYVVVVVLWRLGWGLAGYGVHGSGAYIDPLAHPLDFLAETPVRVLALLHGAFSTPPSDVFFLAPPSDRVLLVAIAVVTVTLIGALAAPLLARDATCRFWALGAVLSIFPVSASFSSDRLVLIATIGGMGLLARLGVHLTTSEIPVVGWRRVLTVCFLMIHLLVAPLLLPIRAAQMQIQGSLTARIQAGLDVVERPEVRATVVVNAPITILATYLQAERAWQGRPRSQSFYMLASASSEVTVERVGDRELAVELADGYLLTPLERHYRASPRGLEPGAQLRFAAMTATVDTAMPDGRPKRVTFRFDDSLDSGAVALLEWSGDHYAPLSLAVGARVRRPAEDFGRILAEQAARLAP